MTVEQLQAYELVEKRRIEDLDSDSYLLRHKKSGARIALLSNKDENKVFYIGFRTPPKNSTGVAHIMEHSVLCGSRKFPLKDPFVELVKGSLNTFLNAMTYPDKTMYPVASCNDKDFQNLMDVYLDAVFYPNIYTNKSIFRQEGWRYEMEEDNLKINGVVYNEMKGAFSSSDDVLEREISNSLFPDVTYGVESGGDPKCIPELTYEEFLEFHKTYYHPSNSYIYLYGNMDMVEKLNFLDAEYLSKFDKIEVDSEIKLQEAFTQTRKYTKKYPIAEGESAEDNTFLSWNVILGKDLDQDLYQAFDILDEAIMSIPGAPVHEALVNKGIGQNVYSIYGENIRQPYYSIIARGVDPAREQEFVDTITETLTDLVKNGIDKKSLLGAINENEFRYREADFGSYPKGLMYGLQMMDSWLYNDAKPFLHIEANETFKRLRGYVETDYFEKLVENCLIHNTHKSVVTLLPEFGLMEQEEEELAKELKKVKDSLSEEELATIQKEAEELRVFQETEDSEEALNTLPLLKRSDMKQETDEIVYEEKKVGDTTFLYHNLFTNGIGYMRYVFSLKDLPGEYYFYLGVYRTLFGMVNTKKHSYLELNNEISLVSGGIGTTAAVVRDRMKDEDSFLTLDVRAKSLYENIEKTIDYMAEILFESDFTDTKRIYDLLQENRSEMQSSMVSAGHSLAAMRAASYGSLAAKYNDEFHGITYYRKLSDLLEHFEERKDELVSKLTQLQHLMFRKENLLLDFCGDSKAGEEFAALSTKIMDSLYTDEVQKERYLPVLENKKEGFLCSAQIQYVCRAGNYNPAIHPYTGALRVLKVIMGYEYLWTNVRVKGGAYGCMFGSGESGDTYFVSYRDPNLEKTIEVFENAPEAIAQFEADERTMTKYIIGTFSGLDVPLSPLAKALKALGCYMSKTTREMLQKEREEILNCTPADIRALSDYMKNAMEDDYLCVIGNANKLKEQKDLFLKLENLI